jgi:NAD-dependent dihydropyrimidine dehydrogenase PreA subunit
MAKQIAVVLAQGQSHNPAKRGLEEAIVTELLMTAGVDTIVVPHPYDLHADHPALLGLKGLAGDFILLSWLYPRAAHWTLDQHGIRGRMGETQLKSLWDERKKKWEKKVQEYRSQDDSPRVADLRPSVPRTIYHLDLRMSEDPRVYLDEVRRIAVELTQPIVSLQSLVPPPLATATETTDPTQQEAPIRRWYPVIDYSRCTNFMECIDFCLFGVYGIDQQETILVEQPDNCRKGCPACSRVCPENAIIFPQHKTPVIAGDPAIGGEMKIDLSQLFGKPSDHDLAARERDEQLRLAGREPVAAGAVVPPPSPAPRDELDDLIDKLDELDN